MTEVFLIIHLILAVALIAIVLVQRSEGGGLGLGTSGGGMGNLLSNRSTANLLTRTTAILATSFMATSLILAILSSRGSESSLVDRLEVQPPVLSQPEPAETPAAPEEPGIPKVPIAE